MTTANMKLVVLNVDLADKMETPEQKLESGEFIVKRVVELSKLNEELKGGSLIPLVHRVLISSLAAYDAKVGFSNVLS